MKILPHDAETLSLAARCVAAGGVIAFRTDTYYGLGANPFNPHALGALKDLKGREEQKPILVVISESEVADRLIKVKSHLFSVLQERHWPGPLTLVAEAHDSVPQELTAGTGTVGVRLPDDEDVRALIRACGGCLTATSANFSGSPPARTASEVSDYFTKGLALIVDGGAARSELPSTVLDVKGARAQLIREGVVTRSELHATLQRINVALI